MRTRNLLFTMACVGGLLQPVWAQSVVADAWAPHRSLKVLYAGSEDGHREVVFGAFLAKWFDKSATLPLAKLSMKTAADYDVVIVDWMSQYGCDGYPKRDGRLHGVPTKLGADFTKPMIAMTYVGTRVRGPYKLNWL